MPTQPPNFGSVVMIQGDTYPITYNYQENGIAIDIITAGYTVYFTVKKKKSDTDANAIIGPKTAIIASPTTGVGVITLTATDTDKPAGEYTYDVKIEDTAGDNVFTVIGPSKYTIIENVT